MSEIPLAALAPFVVLLAGFVVYCLVDIRRSHVRYLPKWLWVVITLVSIPMGGIIYLLVGRDRDGAQL